MIRANPKNSADGFTIIELLIATTVFSIVLLICTTGLLQIGRLYYKGITSSRTQEVARNIMDEITRAIQFNGGRVITRSGGGSDPTTDPYYICVGDQRYTFVLGYQLRDTNDPLNYELRNVLVADHNTACSSGQDLTTVNPAAGSKELLSSRMRLAQFVICDPRDTTNPATPALPGCSNHPPPNSNLYSVRIRVVSGDLDVLNAPRDGCSDSRAGTQFCAASELNTTVLKRIK